MTNEKNSGIIVTGGSFNAGAVAAGPGAQAHVNGSSEGPATIALLVERLEAALARHERTPELAPAIAAASHLSAEAKQERPSPSRILNLLEQVGRTAGSLAPVAGLLKEIASAAARLF